MGNEMSAQINTFDTFIEDDSNKFALAAARAVATSSGREYNPLWLYSPSGCGKTHLLNAISRELEKDPSKKILNFSANSFVGTMLSHYWSKDNEWKEIEKADVLIVDNMEFLRGKDRTQEEIAFLSLRKFEKNSRVIFASDCPPSQLPVIERILRNGSEETLIADIQFPTDSMKQKYIDAFLKLKPFAITDEAQILIVKNAKNIPKLKGVLQTAWFFASHDSKGIDADWVGRNFL